MKTYATATKLELFWTKTNYIIFLLKKTKMKDVSKHKNFFADVYEIVKLIPKGKITTYGAIAAYLGLKSSARMVGWAMNSAHTLSDVPAHRVINRNGLLTGKHHFATPTLMQELLESEGIKVKDDKVQDFDALFWNPFTELE